MGNFRGHNPERGMLHSPKSQRPRRKFITSDSDGDYTDQDYSVGDESNQLVLYEPRTTHHEEREVQFTEPIYHSTPLQQRFPKAIYGHSKGLSSIGAYTAQCAKCYKWRIVPTKEKYEELRETLSRQHFVCARASEWNRNLSCDEPEDMSQDESKVWALDRPEIPQPPPGWDRDVRIRGEGCSKFADVIHPGRCIDHIEGMPKASTTPKKAVKLPTGVAAPLTTKAYSPVSNNGGNGSGKLKTTPYYKSPSGTTLRSLVEIERYLQENPYYIQQGVNLSQFSMLTPQPLQEDYVRKRKYSAPRHLQEPLEPFEVNPLACAPPPSRSELLRMVGASASNPVDLDDDESEYDEPPLRTKNMTPRQASPSSSEHTARSALTEPSSSGELKTRTLKQVSPRLRPTAPPSWPQGGRQPASDIEYFPL